jgi:hypothetical protein
VTLFLVSRYAEGLHAVRAFPESAGAVAKREAGVLRRVGYTAEVFVAPTLADVVRSHPSWFEESGRPTPTTGEKEAGD